jgi:hypothetical protein
VTLALHSPQNIKGNVLPSQVLVLESGMTVPKTQKITFPYGDWPGASPKRQLQHRLSSIFVSPAGDPETALTRGKTDRRF